jgi:hypothetical protein
LGFVLLFYYISKSVVNPRQPVSSEAAAATEVAKKMAKNKRAEENAKKASGAPYMKLDSLCSLNETFEAPNTRKLT